MKGLLTGAAGLYTTRVAMDITNSDIRVISMKGSRIRKWMSSPVPPGLVKDGVIKDPKALAVLVDMLFNSLKLRRKGVICTLTGLPFIFRIINMPRTDHGVKEEAIERAARMEMSVAEDDMFLAWQLLKNSPNQAESEYFAVGVPRTALNPLLETLADAGIKAAKIEVKPLALARAVSYSDAIIVSLEKEYFDIVLVYGGLVRVIHSYGNGARPEDLLGLVNELVDGLNIAIKSFNRDHPQNELKEDLPVLLAGELAVVNGVTEMLAEATGHPVSLVESYLPVPSSFPPQLYAAGTGLLLSPARNARQRYRYSDISINLLEGLKKRKSTTVKAGYVFAVSAAVILLVLLFKISSMRANATRDVKDLENRISAETQKVSAAQQLNREAEAQKKAILEKYSLVEKELQAVQQKNLAIEDLKADFASSIRLVEASLTGEMLFNSVSINKSSVIVNGNCRDSLDVLNFCENLENNDPSVEASVKGIDPLEEGGISFQVVIENKNSSQ